MHYIIFDLEATCWETKWIDRQTEIIEIGAVKYSVYGEPIDSFQTFVKPVDYPQLSHYCTKLTGIAQEDINRAPTFDKVIGQFLHWAEDGGVPKAYGAWGKYDREIIIQECNRSGLEDEWLDPYINFKRQYGDINRIRGRIGLKSALQRERIEFTGDHHRALDDALNLGKIFQKHIDSWIV